MKGVGHPRRDCHGHRDAGDRQNDDRDESWEEFLYRWHFVQKTVLRPARRIILSGRPHVKQGSPARPYTSSFSCCPPISPHASRYVSTELPRFWIAARSESRSDSCKR